MRDSKYEIIKIILLVIIVVFVGYIAFKPAARPRPWQWSGGQLSGELQLMDGTTIPALGEGLSAYQADMECIGRYVVVKLAEIATKLESSLQLQQR